MRQLNPRRPWFPEDLSYFEIVEIIIHVWFAIMLTLFCVAYLGGGLRSSTRIDESRDAPVADAAQPPNRPNGVYAEDKQYDSTEELFGAG